MALYCGDVSENRRLLARRESWMCFLIFDWWWRKNVAVFCLNSGKRKVPVKRSKTTRDSTHFLLFLFLSRPYIPISSWAFESFAKFSGEYCCYLFNDFIQKYYVTWSFIRSIGKEVGSSWNMAFVLLWRVWES